MEGKSVDAKSTNKIKKRKFNKKPKHRIPTLRKIHYEAGACVEGQ